jgi:hypothetical protein
LERLESYRRCGGIPDIDVTGEVTSKKSCWEEGLAGCRELEGEGPLEEDDYVGLGAFSWSLAWGPGFFFF